MRVSHDAGACTTSGMQRELVRAFVCVCVVCVNVSFPSRHSLLTEGLRCAISAPVLVCFVVCVCVCVCVCIYIIYIYIYVIYIYIYIYIYILHTYIAFRCACKARSDHYLW
jgi:hypothetical protein